jgi:hypothetical protein
LQALTQQYSRFEARFAQMHQISSMFGFLYNIHSIQNRTSEQTMEHCLKPEQALQHGDSKDIDASDIYSELQATAKRDPKCASPQDVLNFVCKSKLTAFVPNTFIAIHILWTLPVSCFCGQW